MRIRGDNNDAMPVEPCATLDEAVAMLAGDPLLFEPGTQHRYSIWGWVLVSDPFALQVGFTKEQALARRVHECGRHSQRKCGSIS